MEKLLKMKGRLSSILSLFAAVEGVIEKQGRVYKLFLQSSINQEIVWD